MCMCGLWGLCSQVCGCVLHMGRLENDNECPLPFSAQLSWDSNLEACWFCCCCCCLFVFGYAASSLDSASLYLTVSEYVVMPGSLCGHRAFQLSPSCLEINCSYPLSHLSGP